MKLSDWRDLFIIFGISLIAFSALYGDVIRSGRSANDVYCEYFRNNKNDLYNTLMNPNHQHSINTTCCAYDPGHNQCK
jgi:hypothetical protein